MRTEGLDVTIGADLEAVMWGVAQEPEQVVLAFILDLVDQGLQSMEPITVIFEYIESILEQEGIERD